jgi:Flp pilus assembly protein TadG
VELHSTEVYTPLQSAWIANGVIDRVTASGSPAATTLAGIYRAQKGNYGRRDNTNNTVTFQVKASYETGAAVPSVTWTLTATYTRTGSTLNRVRTVTYTLTHN